MTCFFIFIFCLIENKILILLLNIIVLHVTAPVLEVCATAIMCVHVPAYKANNSISFGMCMTVYSMFVQWCRIPFEVCSVCLPPCLESQGYQCLIQFVYISSLVLLPSPVALSVILLVYSPDLFF